MAKTVTILLGHPDPDPKRFGRHLADAYRTGAENSGALVQTVDIAQLDIPVLRTKADYEAGDTPEALRAARDSIVSADHTAIVFPLWQGTLPALLKAFMEQAFRPGIVFEANKGAGFPIPLMRGKSARIIVTMGMPSVLYRVYFGAHGVRNLKRGILGFAGVKPIRTTLIGGVERDEAGFHAQWLEKMRAIGAKDAGRKTAPAPQRPKTSVIS